MYVIVSTIVFRYKSQDRIVDDLDTKSLFLFSLPPWFDRRNVSPKPLSLHRPPSWEEFQFFSDNSRHRRVKMGIPLAALWRFSLSLSRLYTWEPFKLSLFPRLFPYTLYYILFFFLSCAGLGGSRSLYLSQSEASFPSILLSRFSKTKMYLNTLKYSS